MLRRSWSRGGHGGLCRARRVHQTDIVGDRATIEAPLKATGIAPIVHLDIEGNQPRP